MIEICLIGYLLNHLGCKMVQYTPNEKIKLVFFDFQNKVTFFPFARSFSEVYVRISIPSIGIFENEISQPSKNNLHFSISFLGLYTSNSPN